MDILSLLSRVTIFATLPDQALQRLCEQATILQLAGGDILFNAGDPGDALYIVAVGRLHAVLPDGTEIGEIGRNELVGEVSLLTHEPRMATIVALRDSDLIRLPVDGLRDVLRAHPDVIFDISRLVVARLRQPLNKAPVSAHSVRTIALLSCGDPEELRTAGIRIVELLSKWGSVRLVCPDDDDVCRLRDSELDDPIGSELPLPDSHLSQKLNALEEQHRYIVYLGHCRDIGWTRLCVRQSDRLLAMVAGAGTEFPPALKSALPHELGGRLYLLVLLTAGSPSPPIAVWKKSLGASGHYNVSGLGCDQLASVARQLTGRGVGLVLGGGGARGFAHIGLLRACVELGIPIDLVAGTSMGALIAALVARGNNIEGIADGLNALFVQKNHLNDYTWPSVSLLRGSKASHGLHALFGEVQIEHLPKPYFCVSTNLSSAKAVVHDEGPLHIWLNASMRIPGIAPPVVFDEELFVDGGLLNNLPADRMRILGRGPIIACDVSNSGSLRAFGIKGPDPEGLLDRRLQGVRPGLFNILFRTATVTSDSTSLANSAHSDLFIQMPVAGFGMFDWKKLRELSDIGYQHAVRQLSSNVSLFQN